MSRFKFANWEKRYNYEIDHNILINIDNETSIDRRSISSVKGGIYTEELGSLMDVDKDIREFSCDCGELYGRFYEGEYCSECNSVVKEHYGADIRRVGWINISPYCIINPNAYDFIAKIIGAKKLQTIISYDVERDIDGFPKLNQVLPKGIPFANIGILEFKKRFEEIILYYAAIKGLNEEASILIKNKSAVFSSVIPVSSMYLRPTHISSKKRTVSFDKINAIYVEIISYVNILKKSVSNKNIVSALSTVFAIQQTLQKLYDFVIRSKLSGKTKVIRSQVLGTRMSFSSRMVIRSNVGRYAGMDHVVLPYKGFLELYFLEIINCMKRGYGDPSFKNMTIYEITEYLTKVRFSEEVDEKIYSIMMMMLKKRGDSLRLLINRNPTMDLGSIQCMKVVHITHDARDYTMAIPLMSLKALNGDYDGDVLNVFVLKEKCLIEAFNNGFNPRNLCIDRTGDGYFNPDFCIIKDQLTNLIEFTRPLTDYAVSPKIVVEAK